MSSPKKIFFLTFAFAFFCSAFSQGIIAFEGENPRMKFVEAAKKYLGAPYLEGGASEKGLDSAGLVYAAVFDAFNVQIARVPAAQYSQAEAVLDIDRQAGDLLFFREGNSISHVAIYLGDGQMIHSVEKGESTGVVISSLELPLWKESYVAARRILPSDDSLSEREKQSEKTISQAPQKDEKPKKDKTKINPHLGLDLSGAFNWTLADGDSAKFKVIGGNINLDFYYKRWLFKPGVGMQFRFLPGFGSGVCFPIYLFVTVPGNFRFYTGWILEGSPAEIHDDEYKVCGFFREDSKWALVGVNWASPSFGPKNVKFCFFQDFSMTNFKKDEKMTIAQFFGAAFSFSTGVRICINLSK